MMSRVTGVSVMKGGKSSRVFKPAWSLVVLLSVFQSSLGSNIPPLKELHALTDLANTNANNSIHRGGMLSTWTFTWDSQGNWTGGDPCHGHRGLRCWSKGNLMTLSPPAASLQGTISPAVGNLTSLSSLTLRENQLLGDMAPILASMSSMKILRLQGNRFTGSLSNWVRNMPLLEELTLARNKFDGNFSSGVFSNHTRLAIIDVSNNSLLGPIPDDLVGLPSLQQLLLGGNKFTGKVPSTLTTIFTLKSLDLSRNFLYGYLPKVWNTPNLAYLDLSENNLSGPIPDELMNLSNITTLNLAQNNFTGNVSSVHVSKFGCNAFAGNPGLILPTSECPITESESLPSSGPPTTPADAAVPPPQLSDSKKTKGLSTFTIVALTIGDVALIIMSVVGFVMFCTWCRKKSDIDKEDGDVDSKHRTSIGGKSGDYSRKSTTLGSPSPNLVTGSETTSPVRSSFASKPDVKPALKSVVGVIRDPAKDSRTADVSLEESISMSEFGANIAILDTTLALEFEDLLGAKALVLGGGSFGVVYMACLEDGEMLAIKRIEELTLPDQRAFGKRCAKLAEVLHPNLLQLRAYCWSPQEKLLVFDFMPNGSVHSLLHGAKSSPDSSQEERKGIDWETRLKIAVGTARAVAHLHDSDMVHGNIKASNVLLDDHFEPQISDFGLEMLLQSPLQRHTGATDGYLAPELASSVTRRRTQDGDVYSLGVFLLELLTGKEPGGTNNLDLPSWVQEMTSDDRKVQLFDPALTSMHVLPAQDILEFLELAQACVSTDAAARPSITIVLRTLESIVPGSTAPRSYLKGDNIDSDISFRESPDDIDASFSETTENNPASAFVELPVEDYDHDDDDDASCNNPFLPGYIQPVRV